jgi:dTDP-glucose 4,6-dehydratase
MAARYLVTGGAGFVGSAVVRRLIEATANHVLVVDKLTYAGNLDSLEPIATDPRYRFERADIVDTVTMRQILKDFSPDVIMHLAAESHVDRSIDDPSEFVQTNIVGTFSLLQSALEYWRNLSGISKDNFRFHHVSTDEVFGSLGVAGQFREDTPYRPNSPYSASKAASDHLVRAWQHTYGLPVVTTYCSNNYGPFHFPEKLVPLTIINALQGQPIPVYGTGENIRDWLHVDDHAEALLQVARRGALGHSYNIGGNSEYSNVAVVRSICRLVDELAPSAAIGRREQLITFVTDRPGHDARYAMDATKISHDLGWTPRYSFETGLRQTVQWYLENRSWWERVRSRLYRGERLGIAV